MGGQATPRDKTTVQCRIRVKGIVQWVCALHQIQCTVQQFTMGVTAPCALGA